MSKRFGRNQKRRMQAKIAELHECVRDNQTALSAQYVRANRLADQLRRSIVIEVVDAPYSMDVHALPIRVEARFGDAVMTQQQHIPAQEFLAMNLRDPRIGRDYSERLAHMIFGKFQRFER